MSRWVMPSACAAASAAHTCRATATARASGCGPSLRTSSRRLRPSTYSMTMNGRPSSVASRSSTRTAFGWCSRRVITASLRKRFRKSGSWASRVPTSFSASTSPKATWRALYTDAMPPLPTFDRTSYLPRMTIPGKRSVASRSAPWSRGQMLKSSG